MFLGLRSLIYSSHDLAADKAFWTRVLGVEPYFDMPFYVGFNVGGYELGLDPNGEVEAAAGPVTYWGVENIDEAAADLHSKGVKQIAEIQDVGGGIRLAKYRDAAGFLFGIIENPNFQISIQ